MILNSPTISGSLTVTGNIITSGSITISGSIASASYASNAELLDGLDSTVFTLTSSFVAQTASFTAFTASLNAFSASQNSFTASILAQTASLNAFSASILTFTGSASTRLGTLESYTSSLNNKTSSFATTGSNVFIGTQTITGSVLQSGSFTSTGTLTAQTLVVQTITSSVVYSSGSNIFGNALNNTQTFTGSVLVTGSLTIAGGSSATSYSGATIFGSTIACSPIGCFATSCATSFIGGTMSGTTIYGSTAVCSPVGKFTSCIDAGIGTFSSSVTAKGTLLLGDAGVTNAIINSADGMYFNLDTDLSGGSPEFMFGKGRSGAGSGGTTLFTISCTGAATFSSTITGTTIYGSTAVCSPVGKFTSCIDVCAGYFSGVLQVRNTSSTPSIWSGQFGGAISILGDNSTSNRYIDLSIVDSTGVLATQGLRLVNSGTVLIGSTSALNSEKFGVLMSSNCSVSTVKAVARFSNDGSGYIPKILLTDNNIADATISFIPAGAGTSTLSFGIQGVCIGYQYLNIKENGNVGIGITTPNEKLDVNGVVQVRGSSLGYATTQCVGMLDFYASATRLLSFGGDATTCGCFRFYSAAQNNAGGSDVATISGGGVACFKGTVCAPSGVKFGSGATTLNYYEEGTWSPQIYYQNGTDQTNSTNVTQVGIYTKVGKVVYASGVLQWTITGSPANDNIGIKNLPFTAKTGADYYHWGLVQLVNAGAYPTDGYVMMMQQNATMMLFYDRRADTSNYGDDIGASGTKTARFSITYLST